MAWPSIDTIIERVVDHPEWVREIEYKEKGDIVMFKLSSRPEAIHQGLHIIIYIDSRDGHAGCEYLFEGKWFHEDFFDPKKKLSEKEKMLSDRLYTLIANIANSRR